jgi:type VI secretion system secreted protein Hcp
MAAPDYLLEIDGIQGESTDSKHPNTIEVESFSGGATNTGSFGSGTGGGGAGKVNLQDVHFTAQVSKASPNLFAACAAGKHISKATLYVRKQGGKQEDYMTVKLTKVLVTSYQVGAGAPIAQESFSLNYAKIEFEYKPQDEKGSLGAKVAGGWDLEKNQVV